MKKALKIISLPLLGQAPVLSRGSTLAGAKKPHVDRTGRTGRVERVERIERIGCIGRIGRIGRIGGIGGIELWLQDFSSGDAGWQPMCWLPPVSQLTGY